VRGGRLRWKCRDAADAAHDLKPLRERDHRPQWLLNVVIKSRDPKLADLGAKLMSRGLDELEQDEREALFGAIIGDEPKE
jgi:hypothetical protein